MVEFEYNCLVLLTLAHALNFPHVYGYIVEYLFMEFNQICSSLPALIKWQSETLTMTLRAVRFHESFQKQYVSQMNSASLFVKQSPLFLLQRSAL